jgi:hypothetical protein
MRAGSTGRALRFVAPFLVVVSGGCRSSPSTSAPAAARPPAETAAPPARPAALTVPAGWRELRWGMSRHQTTKQLLSGRHSGLPRPPLERLAATTFPWLDPAGRLVTMPLDPRRFSQWQILDLDEGATRVEVWFDDDHLMAVRAEAAVEHDAFLRKATAAYGGEPTTHTMTFVDPAGSMTRDVAVWRGAWSTVLVYENSRLCGAAAQTGVCPRPTVLVVSAHATRTIGAMVTGAHDDAARAAAAAKAAAEQATRF